ncbi:outer membrane protein OmpK [Thalassotalea nanhaiensis]|uniref:Outer membrane protein OmpK n=1 Tax=Thalassotalea nanhaiensis TaxID=3065648 RepID=A0ABY9TK08_9GAMM|nr:outer membrane protein OmpK [Colwelliaceae bacterium SQ345]
MRKFIIALMATAAMAATTAQAEYQYGFANAYFDGLSWTNGTEGWNGGDISETREDHITFGIEAGAGFSWGEIYGFYEMEKLNMDSDLRSNAFKVSAHYKVLGNITAYGQVYDYNDSGFGDISEQNTVIGIGYVGWSSPDFWFKPFIGVHEVKSGQSDTSFDDINGMNGAMIGWNMGMNFTIAGEKFMLTNWNEIEVDRNKDYAEYQYGETGLNGGIGLWYDITERVYTGIQYRYFQNKLGVDGYGDAIIFRVGVHL